MSEDGHSLSARVFHTLREEILSGKYQKDESAGHRCGKP